jgi:hypothetical protein
MNLHSTIMRKHRNHVNQTLYRGTGDLDTITLPTMTCMIIPHIAMMGNLSGLVVWTNLRGQFLYHLN